MNKHFIFVCLLTFHMPIVTVVMYSGRTQTEKDRLAEAITDDVIRILKVDEKDVIIVFQEAPHGNWYASGVRL
jgi:4-oxalocrotonate tautomerase